MVLKKEITSNFTFNGYCVTLHRSNIIRTFILLIWKPEASVISENLSLEHQLHFNIEVRLEMPKCNIPLILEPFHSNFKIFMCKGGPKWSGCVNSQSQNFRAEAQLSVTRQLTFSRVKKKKGEKISTQIKEDFRADNCWADNHL